MEVHVRIFSDRRRAPHQSTFAHGVAVDLGPRSYGTSITDRCQGRVREAPLQDDVLSYGRAERSIVRVHESCAVEDPLQSLRDDALNLRDEPPLEVRQGP